MAAHKKSKITRAIGSSLMAIPEFLRLLTNIGKMVKTEVRFVCQKISLVCMLSIVLLALLFSSWLCLSCMFFLYLVSLHFTAMISLFIIFMVNVLLMALVILWMMKAKKDLHL